MIDNQWVNTYCISSTLLSDESEIVTGEVLGLYVLEANHVHTKMVKCA